MANRLRLDTGPAAHGPRWVVGVQVSSDCDRVAGALVATVGRGLELRAEVADLSAAPIPRETASLFTELTQPGLVATDSDFAGRVTSLRAQLAEVEALVVGNLLARSEIARARLLAIGVHDPGLWSYGKAASGGYLGLSDAARLVELTQANVIDAFPARDVARGGQGGPITALAEWVLLSDPMRSRMLLDLGRSVRLSYLPCHRAGHAPNRILSFEIGPGMRMLDQLTKRLTGGEQDHDPGGRMAVQGRRIDELEARWLADPYFRRPLPRWQPRGIRPERFLLDALQRAVDSGWSVRDMLCTATHFIAETIALAVRQRLPRDAPVDEILLVGGGQHNGMLLKEIALRLPQIPILRVGQFGPAGEALGPACIALLALFYLDEVPANYSPVTGTEAPRVLGRLTPGSPQNWKRLLAELTTRADPSARPLKAAG
ncbi:MAG: anhydro-N-acetylmuramic acid kinase [Planctomycetota bacterium]